MATVTLARFAARFINPHPAMRQPTGGEVCLLRIAPRLCRNTSKSSTGS